MEEPTDAAKPAAGPTLPEAQAEEAGTATTATAAAAPNVETTGPAETPALPPPPKLKDSLETLPVDSDLANLIVQSYTGDRDDESRFEGKGCAEFIDGNKYEGDFHLGMMHGSGTYSFKDEVVFTGTFLFNKITGSGTYNWPDKSSYTGEVKDGLRHGKGCFTSPDQTTVYDGDWFDGKRHGFGTIYYNSDKSVYYEGHWEHNQRCGQGKVVYPSGNTYSGSWKRNKKNGKGEMLWKNANEKYCGDWVNDKQQGFGEHVWLDENEGRFDKGDTARQRCNLYKGQWLDGKRNGIGTFFYANGSQYHGTWQNNIKQGFGVLTYPDGHVYEGPFENDRMPPKNKANRSSEDVAPQLKLNVTDLLDTTTNEGKQELKLIENMLLRYNSELKVVYKHYAQLRVANFPKLPKKNEAPTLDSSEIVFTMNMEQMRLLCKDCKLINSSLTFAEIQEVFYRMRRHHALCVRASWEGDGEAEKKDGELYYDGEGEGGLSLYDPSRSVLFREFVEGLVRIAFSKYCLVNPEITVKAAIKGIVEDHLRVYATQSGLNPFEEKMRESKVQNVISSNLSLLDSVWNKYSSGGNADGRVMRLRNFVLFVNDCACFGKKKVKNIKTALAFSQPTAHHHHDAMSSSEDILNTSMVKAEFFEAILRLASDSHSEQVPLQEKAKLYLNGTISPLMSTTSSSETPPRDENSGTTPAAASTVADATTITNSAPSNSGNVPAEAGVEAFNVPPRKIIL